MSVLETNQYDAAHRRARRSLVSGIAPGQPSDQRGHDTAEPEGLLEHTDASERLSVPRLLQRPTAAGTAPRSLPRRLPEPRCIRQAPTTPEPDLVAILLTGIPPGIISGFQNYTGTTQADELRLNVAIPPAITTTNPAANSPPTGSACSEETHPASRTDAVSSTTSPLIELQAIAGATLPLVDTKFTADGAASAADRRHHQPSTVPQQLPVPRAPLPGLPGQHCGGPAELGGEGSRGVTLLSPSPIF